jgi:predicted enzyme related to lactoylglutathione lyase
MPEQGRYVWYELMTTDTAGAKTFYTGVVGWETQGMPMPGMPDMTYTMFTAGGAPVGGLMDLPDAVRDMGAPPFWMGYVGVDDVDEAAAQAQRLGGAVHVEPRDIPEVGRFAVLADPQGASLALFKSANPAQDEPAPPDAPGRIGWHELMAVDWEKAFAFYNEMFGWQKAEAVDIGAMGTYQLFSAGGRAIGGMFNKPPQVPAPFWLYYFNVDGIDAAAARVSAGGGRVVNGPMEVPGGSFIVQGLDPQGAMFALVSLRR